MDGGTSAAPAALTKRSTRREAEEAEAGAEEAAEAEAEADGGSAPRASAPSTGTRGSISMALSHRLRSREMPSRVSVGGGGPRAPLEC